MRAGLGATGSQGCLRVRRPTSVAMGAPSRRGLGRWSRQCISHRAAALTHGFWGVADAEPELTVPGTGSAPHRRGADPSLDRIRCRRFDLSERGSDHFAGADADRSRSLGRASTSFLGSSMKAASPVFGPPSRSSNASTASVRDHAGRCGSGSCSLSEWTRPIRTALSNSGCSASSSRGCPPSRCIIDSALGGRIVEFDVAWPEHHIAAEIDGRHVRVSSRTKFDSDRLRSNLLEASGWRVVHLTAGMDDLTLLAQLIPFFPDDLIDARLRSDVARLRCGTYRSIILLMPTAA